MNTEVTEYKFLVEVIFEKIITKNNGNPDMYHDSEIAFEVFQFSGPEKDATQKTAEEFMGKVITEGLTASGGHVVLSVIPPGAIRQVGLIDLQEVPEEEAET